MQRWLGGCSLSLFLMFLGSGVASAQERYYLLVFASQTNPPRATDSHTFATFVKASSEGSDPRTWKLVQHTISWMPKQLELEIRIRPETGENLNLSDTLTWAWEHQAHVSMWGPYEVDKKLCDWAMQQIAWLDSGAVRYRMLDGHLRPTRALNCIHAVSDLVPDEPLIYTGYAYGDEASAMVVRHFQHWIRNSGQINDWLIDRLGLKVYGVVRRK